MKKKVLGIFTCFNRKEKTEKCLKSLIDGNKNIEFTFLAVDDGSTDGTGKVLQEMPNVDVLTGDGGLFREPHLLLFLQKPQYFPYGPPVTYFFVFSLYCSTILALAARLPGFASVFL